MSLESPGNTPTPDFTINEDDEDYEYDTHIAPLLKPENVGKVIEMQHNTQSEDGPELYRIIRGDDGLITYLKI
ncbi:hypothetical protein EB093_08685 [bacterium]|nr:hypothetical protein [bacterium]